MDPAIIVMQTRHLPEAVDPGEDWSGKSSAERRKLQNRLNQRAHRRKKAQTATTTNPPCATVARSSCAASEDLISAYSELKASGNTDTLVTPELEHIIRRFADAAYIRYLQNAPLLSHLPTIVHLNMLNALASNASALGLSRIWLLCESVSPLTQHTPLELACPRVLFPTLLQLTTPHHPWVDLFPIPQFRDNVLRAALHNECFDEDELWYNLVEMKCAHKRAESPSLLVWGEPWDAQNWEANAEFLRKWGYLLEGCWTLLESTNYWRRRRGEKPFPFRSGLDRGLSAS